MSQHDNLMRLMGSIASRQVEMDANSIVRLSDAEFGVFSQFGEDGIIQYLIRKCAILLSERRFVEFGVENYTEANTRFLLVNDNWSGFVMDASQENISYIKNDEISWRHDLQAAYCFVSPENLNALLKWAGFEKNLGLFSIDIDGMDYWVWEALTDVCPVIVICEYNSIFGPSAKITIPYQESFSRTKAHHSNLYFGSSLGALVHIGSLKGYCFVGSNSAGNNAFFVRKDRVGDMPVLTSEEGYIESKFRESRDEFGRLTYARGKNRLSLIEHMPVYDIETKSVRPIREIG